MGVRLKSSLDGNKNMNSPGPGTYSGEKPKADDLQFSIGVKIDNMKSNMQVPGPGTYERYKESTIGTKFSKDQRQSMEAKGNRPGPGQHAPDYTKVKKSAPRFGFGSETRNSIEKSKMSPGPGNYKIRSLIGEEGQHNSIHGTIDYTPEKKEQSYKPGPGVYSPDLLAVKKREPAFKQGTGARGDDAMNKTKSKFQVSPDRYNPKYDFTSTISSPSKWKFGSEPRNSMEAKG